MLHHLQRPFIIDEAANPRFGDPSISEVRRAEQSSHGFYRCCGGDHGDLLFNGYDVEDGKTILRNPAVSTFGPPEDWTEDDWEMLAREIFDASYASIGIETVEHS